MSRLKIEDLPVMENLDATQMKGLFGGFFPFIAAAVVGGYILDKKQRTPQNAPIAGGIIGSVLAPHLGLTSAAGALWGSLHASSQQAARNRRR